MASEIYPHLILPRLGKDWDYLQVSGPIDPRESEPIQNRPAHAAALQTSLEAAAEKFAPWTRRQRQILPESECGIFVRFNGRPGRDPDLSFFEKKSHGAELLAFRKEGRKNIFRAFVPQKSIEKLSSALNRYGSWEEGKQKAPFTDFFEDLGSLSQASVERLWNGPGGLALPKQGVHDWEVWVRTRVVSFVRANADTHSIEVSAYETSFPNSTVIRMRGTFDNLKTLLLSTASVVEIRPASQVAVLPSKMSPVQRVGLMREIAARIHPAAANKPRVTILDTGVQFQHDLLKQSLPETRALTLLPAWKEDDADGHGTRMAGVALFGNMSHLVGNQMPIELTHSLESVVVIGPGAPAMGPAQRVSAAIAKVEKKKHPRVYSMSWSVPADRTDGAPTELSSHLDQLAFGRGAAPRLFCVAAGNVPQQPPLVVGDYIVSNDQAGIFTPGQSANVLTVGAYTDLVGDGSLRAHAGKGDLCPTARTAISWTTGLAFKPDIVMEGGNCVIDPDDVSVSFADELTVLTTCKEIPRHPFDHGCETSIATAAASCLAGRLMSDYPNLWPETIRGLIVHSARWTPAMQARLPGRNKADMKHLLRRFGWGAPDEARARTSASDALTMIVQDDIEAFKIKEGKAKFNRMRFYRLPWPVEALESIAGKDVTLRITLSHFAEPHPLAASNSEIRNYFSHALNFKLCGPDDTDDEAIAFVNKHHRQSGHKAAKPRKKDHWQVGSKAAAGTLKQDVWRGKAGELAHANGISIFPAYGWWTNLRTPIVPETKVRFALIVSIEAPEIPLDLMIETRAALSRLPIRTETKVTV